MDLHEVYQQVQTIESYLPYIKTATYAIEGAIALGFVGLTANFCKMYRSALRSDLEKKLH